MCSYCGCRTIAPIDRFSAEHDDIINATGRLRQSAATGDQEATRVAAHDLGALLDRHTHAEEATLFAALRSDPEFADHIDVLCAEHREIGTVLGQVSAGDLASAASLEHSLRQHIDKEENGLFPAAVIALDAATLAQLAEGAER